MVSPLDVIILNLLTAGQLEIGRGFLFKSLHSPELQ